MKIETKLTFNNMKKNIKRTIYTTISIVLCAFLIITTILVATSISTGFQESIASKYNDYHFVIKNIDIDDPWGYNLSIYKSCAKEIVDCVDKLLEMI